jgi:hypothetical protein
MDAVNHQYQKNNSKKLSKVLSTKLSIEDYNAFQMLTKLEYKSGLIKEESPSELLRFTIRHILKQVIINLNILYSNNNYNNRSYIKTTINHNNFIIKSFYRLLLLLINIKFLTYLAETISLVRK